MINESKIIDESNFSIDTLAITDELYLRVYPQEGKMFTALYTNLDMLLNDTRVKDNDIVLVYKQTSVKKIYKPRASLVDNPSVTKPGNTNRTK